MENSPISTTTNSFTKKMVKDLNSAFVSNDVWHHARNTVVDTHNGDRLTVSNEPSNKLCYQFESSPLSKIELKNNRVLVIQQNGEFGILNTINCIYEKLFQLDCKDTYNFTCRPIQGRSRIVNDQEEYIVFGNVDIPISELNLSKIPYKYTTADDECKTKTYTKSIDCEDLFLFKKIDIPCLNINPVNNKTGSLPNGVYQVAIVYLKEGEKYSDYYSLSLPIHIYNKNGTGGSLNISISNLDRNFDQFQILLISNKTDDTNVNVETYTLSPIYSTLETEINISDLNGTPESLDRIILTKSSPSKVGNISGNSDTLLLSDIVYNEPINYQKQAMNIEIEYVIRQVPLEFYETNSDFGYYGDENYAPGIRWYNNKGEVSDTFHVPGRRKDSRDSGLANGDNVYEFEPNLLCDKPERIERWQNENTASTIIPENNNFNCGERILGRGKMGYFESEYLYPDNKDMFGDDACTPIRYPKFPDECKISRFSVINGKTYINIKAWSFKNIEHPLDINGNPRTDIIGYEIVRKPRLNKDRSILATGYLSNVRGFTENNQDILYQNYPYNDLSPDSFHSSTQTTSKNNRERDFNPLTKVYNNKFSFYTPDANYGLKTALGQELKIFTEEKATVKGRFEPVYNHPKAKIITNFSYYLATLMGVIEAYLEMNGKICKTTQKDSTFPLPNPTPPTPGTPKIDNKKLYQECDTLYTTATTAREDALLGTDFFKKAGRLAVRVLKTTARAIGFGLIASQKADNWLNIIQNFSPERSYVYQYNSVATFLESKCVNKRRFVTDYQYIRPFNTQLKNNQLFANEKSNSTIYVEIQKDIPRNTYTDDSNKTISEFGLCDNISQEVVSTAAMFYAASKIPNRNQYNTLDSGTYIKTHNCIIPVVYKQDTTYSTPIIYGGDCVIVQTSFQTKRHIFSQSFANNNFPENTFINYRQYSNLSYARYWYDNEKVEWSDIISRTPTLGKMPAQRHNFDCRKNSSNLFTIKNEYMYTSVNGVINYIVEADANLSFREQSDKKPHYSKDNTNLSNIFRSDKLELDEVFSLDSAYFKLEANQIFARQQDITFDPLKVITRDKNALIYSLPGYKFQKINNWRYFLPNNIYSFDNAQFGNLVGIHPIDQDRMIFLFDKSSPYISLGRNELQLSEESIIIGDGGLFARQPRELMNTDVYYGATQSKYAFSSNQFGYFYPSASQGRLFKFGQSLEDITKEGLHYWAKTFMPFQLKQFFPNYNEEENPLCGTSYLSVFDNNYETLYISKKDYIPVRSDIVYNDIKGRFEVDNLPISLTDTTYFKDISWTLSYKPTQEGFISFHDWHPDNVLQLENHFMTIKDNGFWKHNERCDSYCNFYGKDYPWEIAPYINNGQNVNLLSSVEYHLEAYHYINNCLDKYHVLKENFDRASVSNSEQHSGLLHLITDTKVTSEGTYKYPKPISSFETEVLCIKKENKYRFNGFVDIVKDRGEQTGLDKYIIKNDESGYKFSLYTQSLDTQNRLKKIRHKNNILWLAKTVSGKTNYIFQFLNTKQNYSFR